MIAYWEPPRYQSTSTYVGTGDLTYPTYPAAANSDVVYFYSTRPQLSETDQLVHDFREHLERWLATYNIWAGMARAARRAAFFARRLRDSFIQRDARPRRRSCSMASRWMVTR
jgi:hypothetical protein